MAATAGVRALQGAGLGAATAAMEPVTDDSKGYGAQKGKQVAAGLFAGAILTPALGKVADVVVSRFARAAPNARRFWRADGCRNYSGTPRNGAGHS